MSVNANLAICHACDHRQQNCAGACLCEDTDIIERAEQHCCPLNKFPARGLGDTVAAAIRAVGIDRVVKAISVATGTPCRCDERQADLNKAVPY
jgi:hypothetical protein